uniref:Uncharacterized protein n=1 Tax=Salmonella enterica subsp. indica TaxID=59207 RepID=I3W3U3_SALER|nr:hypothetical protein [Salmonella enterica subsp. indica]
MGKVNSSQLDAMSFVMQRKKPPIRWQDIVGGLPPFHHNLNIGGMYRT